MNMMFDNERDSCRRRRQRRARNVKFSLVMMMLAAVFTNWSPHSVKILPKVAVEAAAYTVGTCVFGGHLCASATPTTPAPTATSSAISQERSVGGNAWRTCGRSSSSTTSRTDALSMVKNRGLEVRREGATPTEGGMTLYLKAGPDGTSVGDCPFAHYVRMVLEEKGLEYDLKPSTAETKPSWLVEFYEGKMPALRHRKECYTESGVIAEYLDFFFPEPPLSVQKKGADGKQELADAESAIEGFFPAVAKYLKHRPDGDDDDLELKANLESSLQKLNEHMQRDGRTGPFLVGDGEKITLLDCGLIPKLYHMQVGIESFKQNAINIEEQFEQVWAYMKAMYERESFQKTVYGEDVIVWGWGNARK